MTKGSLPSLRNPEWCAQKVVVVKYVVNDVVNDDNSPEGGSTEPSGVEGLHR